MFVLPASGGNNFAFALPALANPLTLYAQGANQTFTTIGFTTDFQLSNGLRIDIVP